MLADIEVDPGCRVNFGTKHEVLVCFCLAHEFYTLTTFEGRVLIN